MAPSKPLRIGYVPEHFSTPLYFAKQHFGLDAELISFPSGTGHMITSIRSNEIDVGIGLTEGLVAGLGKADLEGDGGYRIVGTYVETPLCWAISTGSSRDVSISSLQNRKVGVSRIGSGSYVMAFVLADQQGWLFSSEPFDFIPLQTFAALREAVNDKTADFFMWEHFTSKKYHDNGEIKRIGEIYTPWSSWKIVAATRLTGDADDPRLKDMFEKIDQGVEYFDKHHDEAVEYVSTELDYSEGDAKEWMDSVKFASRSEGVDVAMIEKTVGVLKKAGVLGDEAMQPTEMIATQKGAQLP